jgi:hypothetical protein
MADRRCEGSYFLQKVLLGLPSASDYFIEEGGWKYFHASTTKRRPNA